MFRRRLSLIAILLFMSMTGSVAHAQDETSSSPAESGVEVRFGILPADRSAGDYYNDVPVGAGETVTLEALIVNQGTAEVDLRVFRADVTNGVNGGLVAAESTEEPSGIATWIDLETFEISLEPGSEQLIDFDVTVPPDTPPGQYVTSVLVEMTEATPIAGQEMFDHVIRYSMAVVILVPGEITYGFEIGEPELEDDLVFVPIQNTGNYLVQPTGELTFVNEDGVEILQAPVQMQSIYTGLSAPLVIPLPDQFAPGDYEVNIVLSDTDSGFETSREGAILHIPDDGFTGTRLSSSSIEPNDEDIAFANVSINLDNEGEQIEASTVTLGVFRDGELVDEFPLATNQVMLSGENTYETRYIPPDMWEPGTYTFSIVVHAVDPNGGQQIELLNEELDAEIVVP